MTESHAAPILATGIPSPPVLDYDSLPIPMGILSVRTGKFLHLNDEYLRVTGFRLEELLGRDHREFGEWMGSREASPRRELEATGRLAPREGRIVCRDGTELAALVAASRIEAPDGPQVAFALFDISRRKRQEEALRIAAAGPSSRPGDGFLDHLVQQISEAIEMEYVFIARLSAGSADRLTAVAVWSDGRPGDGFEYQVAGTPCERTVADGPTAWPTGIQGLFPDDPRLREMNVESYVGVPLLDRHGEPVGVVAAFGKESLLAQFVDITTQFLNVFAVRATSELERDATEERLRTAQARFESIFRRAPVGMAIVELPSRRIVDANDRLLEFTELSRDELVGHRFRSVGLLKDPSVVEAFISELTQFGRTSNFELEIETKGGQRIVSNVSAEVLDLDGVPRILLVANDVSELRRAQGRLENTLRSLAESQALAHVGSWDYDIASSTLSWSEETYRIFGVERRTFVLSYQAVKQMIDERDRRMVDDAVQDALAGSGSLDIAFRFVRPDGSERMAREVGSVEFDDDQKPIRVFGSLQDVTDQRDAEAALRASQEQFFQAQKMEAVGQLAGGIAHDFNNLMTVVEGYASMLGESFDESDERSVYIREIQSAGTSAANLTGQLLAIGRRQMGAMQDVEVNDVVEHVTGMLSRLLREDVSLETSLGDGIAPVQMDPTQLEQVVMNLVVNARDALPEGGHVFVRTISSTLEDGRPAVTLEVEDDGVGMDEEALSRIFEPFYTTKEAGRGTGLGLATAYGIVATADGTIGVDSTAGVGTTFTIQLPASGPEERRTEG